MLWYCHCSKADSGSPLVFDLCLLHSVFVSVGVCVTCDLLFVNTEELNLVSHWALHINYHPTNGQASPQFTFNEHRWKLTRLHGRTHTPPHRHTWSDTYTCTQKDIFTQMSSKYRSAKVWAQSCYITWAVIGQYNQVVRVVSVCIVFHNRRKPWALLDLQVNFRHCLPLQINRIKLTSYQISPTKALISNAEG